MARPAGLSDVSRPRGGITTEYTHEELVAKWGEFFEIHRYDARIMELADLYPERRSLEVQFEELNRYDTDFGLYLLQKPNNSLLAGEQAMQSMMPARDTKPRPHLRMLGLPVDQQVPIRDLRAKHLGRFLAIQGLVRKATEVRPKVTDAMFRCLRCGTVLKEEQEGEMFREPLECYGDQGGCKRSASATKFVLVGEESLYLDTQKIEVQEAPEGLRGGEEPQRLAAWAEDDLAGTTNPGARLVLNGVLRISQRGRPGAKSTLFDIYLEIHSIEYTEKEFDEIQITPADVAAIREAASQPGIIDRIRRSIAPSLGGLEKEKEALGLQLFSGIAKTMPDGRRIRGDIHILLVGDPGTGKSELLMYLRGLAPRAVFAVGGATTAAGLIAAAVHDEFGEGRWTLEAGALVLADKGLALIDEVDKMSEQDRSSIHAAMEQQQVSIAKAGITATLPTRCAILAAANPKFGRFAVGKAISEQISMQPTLLSRFDCIFTIHDEPDPLQDSLLADHMLKGHLLGAQRAAMAHDPTIRLDPVLEAIYKPEFDPEFLRKYVAYARRYYPVMTPDAMDVIKGKYLEIRRSGGGSTEPGGSVPITPRQLEAFVRLSEASARARLSPLVVADDARRAVDLVEYWLRKVAGGEGGTYDIDRVVTGFSTTQRGELIALRDIIAALSLDAKGADEDEILRRSVAAGIPDHRVKELLTRLSKEGDIYSPTPGKYRLLQRL